MNPRLAARDIHALRRVAELRVVAVRQLAVLGQRNIRALRRRLGAMAEAGLIVMTPRSFGKGRGRPERVLSLTGLGAKLLRERGVLDAETLDEMVTADSLHCVEHQLLVNELRVLLTQMERLMPAVSVQFLSPVSPLKGHHVKGWPVVRETLTAPKAPQGEITFVPDGVFCIRHAELDRMLLFFLEVDRGTETLASRKHGKGDVRQKIRNYQLYFATKAYKRYEQIWNCKVRGFRVLFLTNTHERRIALNKLVHQTQPSDFIWVTDETSLKSDGVWAPIWSRGGEVGGGLQSILGSRAPVPSPSPADVG